MALANGVYPVTITAIRSDGVTNTITTTITIGNDNIVQLGSILKQNTLYPLLTDIISPLGVITGSVEGIIVHPLISEQIVQLGTITRVSVLNGITTQIDQDLISPIGVITRSVVLNGITTQVGQNVLSPVGTITRVSVLNGITTQVSQNVVSLLSTINRSIIPNSIVSIVNSSDIKVFAVLNDVSLSILQRIALLSDVTLSGAPDNKQAILNNVVLSRKILVAILNNVTLSFAPEITPITEYLRFNYILSGSLADNLMEIYYSVVDGYSFGNKLDPEVVRVNRDLGRYLFKVVFSDGSEVVKETYYEFVYYFIQAVASGKRLQGANDVERHMSLAKYLPSTFNPNWLLPVAIY